MFASHIHVYTCDVYTTLEALFKKKETEVNYSLYSFSFLPILWQREKEKSKACQLIM